MIRRGLTLRARRVVRVAGVDEAGRGPLAGPVVAAAVILDPLRPIRGLADSKALTPEERGILAPRIRERALAYAVGWADREEIDCLNILQATFLAMRRALLRLPVCPTHIEVDGNQLPRIDDLRLGCTAQAIIGGDATRSAISAASILAKTTRDALMEQLDMRYPGFNFASHKGYSTPEHLAALEVRKPCPLHRRSFQPVADLLDAIEFEQQLGLA
jgi:ribonuclease HII